MEAQSRFSEATSDNAAHYWATWFHVSRFQKLKRDQQQYGRKLQKQKLHALLEDVALAASRHDSFVVYQTIQKYTPKQPKKRIRLCMHDGTPATPDQVLTMTKEYIQEVWQTASQIVLPAMPPPGIPFTLDELIAEIARTPVTKSGQDMSSRPLLADKCQYGWTICLSEVARLVESESSFCPVSMESSSFDIYPQTSQDT